MDFKVPSLIPQDLQVIQDLVGDILPSPAPKVEGVDSHIKQEDESIQSSDDEDGASEREVEADILGLTDDDKDHIEPSVTSDSSDSDSSDSDSEPEFQKKTSAKQAKNPDALGEDDDEGGGGIVSPDQVRTQNEVGEVNVVIPEVEEVGNEEVLEKVGEIMSIIDKVVIVKGAASQVQNRGSDKALDSDTLLVFEDRKVLGYIWETFGPTSQPFYRIQFNEKYPLDPEKVRLSREVYHIPIRSNFVFVSQLKALKGSDASNAHDEEPAEDEVEFSDDEAEREHKRNIKDRRGGGESSSSRQPSPSPSHIRESYLDDDTYVANPYDAAYNDMDIGGAPVRPPPMPYDEDPYSDSYGIPEASTSSTSPPSTSTQLPPPAPPSYAPTENSRGRGQGRGRPSSRGNGREQGRGRGQDRRRGDRQHGRGRGRGRGGGGHFPPSVHEEYDPRSGRALSPTSTAISRVTGQYSNATNFDITQQTVPQSLHAGVADNGWGQQQYLNQYNFNYPHQQPYVQPHINPRFASLFGINVPQAFPQQQHQPYNAYGQGPSYSNEQPWANQWTAYDGSSQPDQHNGPNPHGS
ncbi:NAF1-domain-containing protein [Trametopsis cervina]|nr:NAF1-domain-containing protein [Trametopsis cervina]